MDSDYLTTLQKRYEPAKIRMAVRCYEKNIPERFWFENTDEPELISAAEDIILEDSWLVLLGQNNYEISLYISNILRQNRLMNLKSRFIDFSDFVYNYFEIKNRHSFFSIINESELLSFSSLRYDEKLRYYSDDFIGFLNNMINNSKSKKLILGIEADEKKFKKFGSFYDYVMDNDFIKLIQI